MRILILAILLLVVGCAPATRYRYGTPSSVAVGDATERPDGLRTNQYLKLGEILQGYLGRPYAGRSTEDPGLDCSQFVREVYAKYDGRKLPRRSADQAAKGTPVSRRALVYGDLIFFVTSGRAVSHVGIFVGDGEFVHASSSKGIIVSKMSERYWDTRFHSARRILP